MSSLLSIALLAASALGADPSRARPVLEAIASECSDEVCVIDAVVWGWHESSLTALPRPWSWDAHAGISCGYWQMPCSGEGVGSATHQARAWVRRRAGSLARHGDLRELAGDTVAGMRIARARAAEAEDVAFAVSLPVPR